MSDPLINHPPPGAPHGIPIRQQGLRGPHAIVPSTGANGPLYGYISSSSSSPSSSPVLSHLSPSASFSLSSSSSTTPTPFSTSDHYLNNSSSNHNNSTNTFSSSSSSSSSSTTNSTHFDHGTNPTCQTKYTHYHHTTSAIPPPLPLVMAATRLICLSAIPYTRECVRRGGIDGLIRYLKTTDGIEQQQLGAWGQVLTCLISMNRHYHRHQDEVEEDGVQIDQLQQRIMTTGVLATVVALLEVFIWCCESDSEHEAVIEVKEMGASLRWNMFPEEGRYWMSSGGDGKEMEYAVNEGLSVASTFDNYAPFNLSVYEFAQASHGNVHSANLPAPSSTLTTPKSYLDSDLFSDADEDEQELQVLEEYSSDQSHDNWMADIDDVAAIHSNLQDIEIENLDLGFSNQQLDLPTREMILGCAAAAVSPSLDDMWSSPEMSRKVENLVSTVNAVGSGAENSFTVAVASTESNTPLGSSLPSEATPSTLLLTHPGKVAVDYGLILLQHHERDALSSSPHSSPYCKTSAEQSTTQTPAKAPFIKGVRGGSSSLTLLRGLKEFPCLSPRDPTAVSSDIDFSTDMEEASGTVSGPFACSSAESITLPTVEPQSDVVSFLELDNHLATCSVTTNDNEAMEENPGNVLAYFGLSDADDEEAYTQEYLSPSDSEYSGPLNLFGRPLASSQNYRHLSDSWSPPSRSLSPLLGQQSKRKKTEQQHNRPQTQPNLHHLLDRNSKAINVDLAQRSLLEQSVISTVQPEEKTSLPSPHTSQVQNAMALCSLSSSPIHEDDGDDADDSENDDDDDDGGDGDDTDMINLLDGSISNLRNEIRRDSRMDDVGDMTTKGKGTKKGTKRKLDHKDDTNNNPTRDQSGEQERQDRPLVPAARARKRKGKEFYNYKGWCNRCQEMGNYRDKNNFERHLNKCNRVMIKCRFCPKELSRPDTLRKHEMQCRERPKGIQEEGVGNG